MQATAQDMHGTKGGEEEADPKKRIDTILRVSKMFNRRMSEELLQGKSHISAS